MADAMPKGVVAVLTDARGVVLAHAADFEAGSSFDTQADRARHLLALRFVGDQVGPLVGRTIERWQCDEIVRRLIADGTLRRTIIPIGHDHREVEVAPNRTPPLDDGAPPAGGAHG